MYDTRRLWQVCRHLTIGCHVLIYAWNLLITGFRLHKKKPWPTEGQSEYKVRWVWAPPNWIFRLRCHLGIWKCLSAQSKWIYNFMFYVCARKYAWLYHCQLRPYVPYPSLGPVKWDFTWKRNHGNPKNLVFHKVSHGKCFPVFFGY